MDVFRNQLGSANPARQDLPNYYPILKNLDLLRSKEGEYQRPGLADLLALQALFESTGGRLSPNIFGVLPGGEDSGMRRYFESIPEAIDYQLGPQVLGGGVGNKLNILGSQGEIMPEEISSLYQSYDPHGAYVDKLIEAYRQIRGL